MSPEPLLLSQDTEDLFRSKTIDEIKEISAQFSWSMGETRRELRTTVGERYRDLLSSAETIVSMNAQVSSLSSSLASLVTHVEKITPRRDVLLAPKAQRTPSSIEIAPSNLPYFNVASQIKLLRDIPDLIWSRLEENLYASVQLYLLGSHIRTNLLCASQSDASIVNQHFLPLIQRQWESISHFRSTLLSSLRKKLASRGEDASLLAGIVLLDPPSSALSLYKNTVLQVRRSRLQDIVVSSVSGKEYVSEVLFTIRSTLMLLKSAFLDGDLKESLSDSQGPTLELHHLFTTLSPISKFLPPVVKDFIPSVLLQESFLKVEDVREITREWLDEVHGFLKSETKTRILDHVSTIEGLASIRKQIYEMLSGLNDESQWDSICNEILGSPLNLWNEFFESIFLERVESLIESKVGGSIYVIESSLDTLLKSPNLQGQSNLSSYMWSEGTGSKEELSMQTNCFSPEIQSLCSTFDSTFKSLLEDMSSYVENPSDLESFKKSVLRKNVSEPFSLLANNESILGYTKITIDKQLNDLFARIGSKYGNSQIPEAMLLHIGRLYQALPELSRYWKEALTKTVSSDKLLSTRTKNENVLNDLRSEFEKQSKLFFNYWKSTCLHKLDQSICFGEGDQKTYLEIIPKWESLAITEETEEGNVVESIIHVPNQPSTVLVASLNSLCTIVYNVGSQSFPPGILNSLSQEICLRLLYIYDEKSLKRLQKIPQVVALQLLFDLKFIHQIMMLGDSSELSEKYESLMNGLENHIDPFDLDVFSEHINKRVQKCALTYQCLFGGIIPSSRYALLNSLKPLQGTSVSSKDKQQSHNVLNTASNSKIRFPLLPIPSGGSNVSSRASLSRLVPDLNKRKLLTKSVDSSATSSGGFLSVMSSSLFGSK